MPDESVSRVGLVLCGDNGLGVERIGRGVGLEPAQAVSTRREDKMEFRGRLGTVLVCPLGIEGDYDINLKWEVTSDGKLGETTYLVMDKWKLGFGGGEPAQRVSVLLY